MASLVDSVTPEASPMKSTIQSTLKHQQTGAKSAQKYQQSEAQSTAKARAQARRQRRRYAWHHGSKGSVRLPGTHHASALRHHVSLARSTALPTVAEDNEEVSPSRHKRLSADGATAAGASKRVSDPSLT